MKDSNKFSNLKKGYTFISFLILGILISASIAFSHGGKHAAGEFTHLEALKKATELYDKLIGKGKLDQTWEKGLAMVEVSNRQKGGKEEVVVSFHRAEGEPKAVYIFFAAGGKYAGSNFTGE